MKTFKSYSPLPASLRPCTLNCRRISEGAAAARQPEANTFNGFPLIEKICLHLLFSPRLGECKRRWKRNECCELRRRREERTLQMVGAVEKPGGGQGGNDNDKFFQQTNAIRG